MKIVCDNCATKYSIADEKVRGKVFKIRCKKCSHVIVVRGGEGGAAVAEPTGDLGLDGEEGTTVSPPLGQATGDSVWHLVIDREQVGPMTPTEVRAKFAAGQVDAETYAWREGFGDWLRLASIDEFKDLGAAKIAPEQRTLIGSDMPPEVAALAARASSRDSARDQVDDDSSTRRTDHADVFASHQASHADDDDGGAADLFGGGGARAAAPAAAAAPPGDDPFASSGGGLGSSGDFGATAVAGSPGSGGSLGDSFGESSGNGAGGAKLTGQRNENSVLFSLNNLQALATGKPGGGGSSSSSKSDASAAKPGYASSSSEGSGLIDIRAMAAQTLSSPAAPTSSNSSSDSPGLGAAPLFSSVVAAPILMPSQQSGTPKWVWGVVAGGGVLVAAIVGLAVIVLTKKDPVQQPPVLAVNTIQQPATNAAGAGTAVAGAGSAAVKTETPAAKSDSPAGDGKSVKEEKGEEAKKSHHSDHGGSKHETKGGEKVASATQATSTPSAAPTPSAAAPEKKESKKAGKGDDLDDLLDNATGGAEKPKKKAKPAEDDSGGGADDNLPEQLTRDDIKAGMAGVQARAKACFQSFHVPGNVLMGVVIGKGGRITNAEAKGVLAGTPTGDCVTKAVKSASFKKFKGNAMSITYPFVLP